MKEKYKFDKFILTTNKGLNSGKNLAYLTNNKDGYVVSQKLRGLSKGFVEKRVANQNDYVYNSSRTFKSKSFIRNREDKDEDGKSVVLKKK